MKGIAVIRWLAVTMAALFLLAQGLGYAHAAEHGADHDHEGTPCAVVVLGEDQIDIPLPPVIETVIAEEQPAISLQPTHVLAFEDIASCRAPPPRAPPAPLHT